MPVADERRVPLPPGKTAWPPAATWSEGWWAAWLRGKGWADPQIIEYLNQRRALTLAVTKGKGKSAEKVVFYTPTPRAVQFHLNPTPNLFFGGAAGGAKSYTARHDAYMRLLTLPGSKLLLLRRKFTELTDNHINDAQREVGRMREAGIPVRYLKDERKVIVERKGQDDAWLRFGHCENEGDEEQYLSSAYEAVYLDEAATFTQKQAMGVQSRLRSTLSDLCMFRCLSNPGGAQTLWLKRFFIDRAVGPEEHEGYQPEEWAFISSKLWDNPYYMDPDGTWSKYARRLQGYGPERARQMLDGDFDVIAGQFFGEFRRDLHVADLGKVDPDIQWFRCLDWGYNAPGVCYWVACLPDGRLYVAHEYVFRQTIAADVAAEIRRQTLALGCQVRYTAADPAMFNKTGHIGESMAETFAKHGVPLKPANHDREIGWQRVRHWLKPAPDGRPWLVISPACGYLVRTLPALVSDEHKPDDVDTEGDDHGADALRYGLMSRPAPTVFSTERPAPRPGTVGALVAEARAAAGRKRRLGAHAVRRHA
jgi:phage terminase large subunit